MPALAGAAGWRANLALIAPSLVAMSLVLSSFAGSAGHPLSVARPLVGSVVFGAVVVFVAVAVLRRPVAAAVVASLLVIGLSGTGGLALILALALVWVILVRWQVMHGRPAPDMTSRAVIGLASALLIGGLVAAVMAHGFDSRDWIGRGGIGSPAARPANIYVLLVDGYPSASTLRETYDLDDEPFLSSLERLGFVVDRESRSTHDVTELSLLGMLSGSSNLTESDTFGATALPATRELRRELRSAPGTAALREAGYELVTLASPIDPATLDGWDQVISNGHLSDFEIAILGGSLLGPLLGDAIMDDLRARIVDQLRDLPQLADPSIQRLVFTHVMAPHPPFLWDQDGQGTGPPACWPNACQLFTGAMEHLGLAKDAYVPKMRAQVGHLNGLVEASVRSLVERDPAGIVVILSDHGSRYSDFDRPEHFRNLFAVRSPTGTGLGTSQTPDDLFVRLLTLASPTGYR